MTHFGIPVTLLVVGVALVAGCAWLVSDEPGINLVVFIPLAMPLFLLTLAGGAIMAFAGLVGVVVVAWNRRRRSFPQR